LTEYLVGFANRFDWPPDVTRRQRLGDLTLFLARKE